MNLLVHLHKATRQREDRIIKQMSACKLLFAVMMLADNMCYGLALGVQHQQGEMVSFEALDSSPSFVDGRRF